MAKGIINAFDHMALCLVINLTKDGNWTIPRPLIFATGYVSFATTFYTTSKYLLPTEKVLALFFFPSYHISLVMRQSLFLPTQFQKSRSIYKMDLDFWDCLGRII